MTEREEFEQWAASQTLPHKLDRAPGNPDVYNWASAENAWQAWQAGRKALGFKELQRELRKIKKSLRELSDSVLMFLHWMDITVGPDKSVPRSLSEKLGKAATSLDMRNDSVRRFALGLSITAEDKKRAALELAKSHTGAVVA